MAKITIQVDTETKTISAVINEKEIENVRAVNFYIERDTDGNPSWMDATIDVRENEDDVMKNISYYASGTAQEKFITTACLPANKDIEGFVGVEKSVFIDKSVAKDIEKYFESIR